MRPSIGFAVLAMAGLCVSAPLYAQEAAETGAILSGVGQEASAGRSLGNSISRGMDAVASRLDQASRSGSRSTAPARRRAPGPRSVNYIYPGAYSVPDVLKHTDAATYRLRNGVIIRTSGLFVASRDARCIANCRAG